MGRRTYLCATATAAIAAIAAAGACKDDPPPAVAFEYGTYVLTTVDGRPLPAMADKSDQFQREILSGSLTLEKDPARDAENPGGNLMLIESSRILPKGDAPAKEAMRRSTGVFFAGPTSLKLRFHGNETETFEAGVSGTELHVNFGGASTMIYKK